MNTLVKPQEKKGIDHYPERISELIKELSDGKNECEVEVLLHLVDISYRAGYIDGWECMRMMGEEIL